MLYHVQLNYNNKNTDLETEKIIKVLDKICEVTPILIQGTHKEGVVPASLIYLLDSRNNSKLCLQNLQSKLSDIIGNRKTLHKLDYGNLLISYVVYKILSHKTNIYNHCFEYLKKEEILGEVSNRLLLLLIRELLEDYVRKMMTKKASIQKEKIIAKDVIALLKYSVSPNNMIREISQQLLCNITPMNVSRLNINTCYSHKFPYVVEFESVLETALDMLGCAHNEILKAYTSVSPSIILPHSGSILMLPSPQSIRQQVYQFLCSFIGDSLGKSFYMGSQGVISAFASYINTSSIIIKNSPKSAQNSQFSSVFNFSILFVNHHYYSYKLFPKCPYSTFSLYSDPLSFQN